MSELRGIYTLWLREVKRYTREKTRLISSFIQPLLWLIIFGSGMRLAFNWLDGNQLPGVHLPRNRRPNAALHVDVHGHIRNLG